MSGECNNHSGLCEQIRAVKESIQAFNDNQAKIVENQQELVKTVAVVHESAKSAHHRLDTMEEQTRAIIRMSVSVENMSEKMQEMIDLFKDHDGRIDVLEKVPAQEMIEINKRINQVSAKASQEATALQDQITEIKNAPAQSVLAYWKQAVGVAITALVMFVLGLLFKGGVGK